MLQLEDAPRRDRAVDRGAHGGAVVGVDIVVEPVGTGLGGIAQEIPPIQLAHLAPVGAHPVHHVRASGDERPIPRLTVAQRGFGALSNIHVDVHPGPLLDIAVHIEHGGGAHIGPAPAAIWRAEAELGVDEPAGSHRFAPLMFGIGAVVGMNRVQPAVADPFFQRLAGVGPPARAVRDDDAGGVGFPHRLRQAADQEAVPRFALTQVGFGAVARGGVPEQQGDAVVVRRTDRRDEHVVPAAGRLMISFEPARDASPGHVRIPLEPMPFGVEPQVGVGLSGYVLQPGLLLEQAIDLEMAQVDRRAIGVADDLDDAEPFVDQFEQRSHRAGALRPDGRKILRHTV